MRKLIVFASALALSGSMAFAMEEKAMDEMMEAPAPSVAVGGSAKIGIINEDDDSDATEDFKLIREYKVTFASSGTTDGGLMFGAGISIEDTHDDDPHQGVNGSHVYVGGADGSWKLQFGGNDPGIDLAGGFGVADDHFGGEGDKTIALSGAFGDTSYRITAADPALAKGSAGDNDWSLGVSHSINTISVGVGMDSESGLAIGVGTDLSGVSTFLYWSKSELKNVVLSNNNTEDNAGDDITATAQENSGLGVKASMSAGEGATFSVGYSTLKVENQSATDAFDDTLKTKLIEIDFSYDLGGGAKLTAGIDKKDAESNYRAEDADIGSNTAGDIRSSDTTTLEAAIAFSF